METFCRSLTAGLSAADLDKLVAEEGYRLTAIPIEQRAIVHDSRSMGRFVCDVEFRGAGSQLPGIHIMTDLFSVLRCLKEALHKYHGPIFVIPAKAGIQWFQRV